MTDAPDPYKTLQVDPEAEDEVIAAAYRRLARKYHPDTAGPDGAARMAAINAAWERVGDPARRAAYDRERAVAAAMARAGAGQTTTPPSAPSRPPSAPSPPATPRPPDTAPSDWTTGRSTIGGGYDPSMRTADGEGAAGPPPGNPSGSVLTFGRYARWSLGEIGRVDSGYLEWLDRMPIGRPYRDEIDVILRRAGQRRSASTDEQARRGLFRRR